MAEALDHFVHEVVVLPILVNVVFHTLFWRNTLPGVHVHDFR